MPALRVLTRARARPRPTPTAGLWLLVEQTRLLRWDGTTTLVFPIGQPAGYRADTRLVPVGSAPDVFGVLAGAIRYVHGGGTAGIEIYALTFNPTTGGLDLAETVNPPAPAGSGGSAREWGGRLQSAGGSVSVVADQLSLGASGNNVIVVYSGGGVAGMTTETDPTLFIRGTDDYPGTTYAGLTLLDEGSTTRTGDRYFFATTPATIGQHNAGRWLWWSTGTHVYGTNPDPPYNPLGVSVPGLAWVESGLPSNPNAWTKVTMLPPDTGWDLGGTTPGDYPDYAGSTPAGGSTGRDVISNYAGGAVGWASVWTGGQYDPATGQTNIYFSWFVDPDYNIVPGWRADARDELDGLGPVGVGPQINGYGLWQLAWTGWTSHVPQIGEYATLWLYKWNGPDDPTNWTPWASVTALQTVWGDWNWAGCLVNDIADPILHLVNCGVLNNVGTSPEEYDALYTGTVNVTSYAIGVAPTDDDPTPWTVQEEIYSFVDARLAGPPRIWLTYV